MAVENAWTQFAEYIERRRTAKQLYALSDEILNDIGLARKDIDSVIYRV